jgi:nucleotide-binding universal stress UspA family protein
MVKDKSRRRTAKMFEKILVCLDGSRLAEQILPYAMEQATRFHSKVILIQAYTIPSSIAAAEAQAAPVNSDLMQEEAQRLEAEAKAYLEKVAAPLREKGLDVACITLQGTAGDAIVGYAQNEPVDLIALATHGHSGLGRVIFGSVADHVLRESGLPILVIKPQETKT